MNKSMAEAVREYVRKNGVESVSLPAWAKCLLLGSRVLRGPIYWAPLVVFMSLILLASAEIDWWQFSGSAALFAMSWLGISAGVVAGSMDEAGVLEAYLSLIGAQSRIGRLMVKRFGRCA